MYEKVLYNFYAYHCNQIGKDPGTIQGFLSDEKSMMKTMQIMLCVLKKPQLN